MCKTLSSLFQLLQRGVTGCTRIAESSSFCRAWLRDTLADHLSPGVQMLAYNPTISLIAVLVVFLLVSIIYIPLFITSYIITPVGSWLVLVCGIVYMLQTLGRSIAFPGSTMSLQLEISNEYLRRVLEQLAGIVNSGSVIFSIFFRKLT